MYEDLDRFAQLKFNRKVGLIYKEAREQVKEMRNEYAAITGSSGVRSGQQEASIGRVQIDAAEPWEQVLDCHFRSIRDPESALMGRDWPFGKQPAVMRIRVTTANVMNALRERDPGAAKPYNFAISPILTLAPPDCTLIAPFSKHSKDWLTQGYTEIRTGEIVQLGCEYRGKKLLPQTLWAVVWRHYLHPEEKSLAPDGRRCNSDTKGLLRRRPIRAVFPFIFIGKEVERRAQEGEDIRLAENVRPRTYAPRQTANTRAADAGLIQRAEKFSIRRLMQGSGVSQHAIERFLSGERIHPTTRTRLAKAVERLESEGREYMPRLS